MHITNINNTQVMIRHETIIDSDDMFYLTINDNIKNKDELLFFDNFIKQKFKNKQIAVQIFEIIDKTMSFSVYNPPDDYYIGSINQKSYNDHFIKNH